MCHVFELGIPISLGKNRFSNILGNGEIYYLEDDVVRLHGIGAGEGRRACEQLEHEDAEGPVVGADVVALVQDHLGCHILRGAAESPCFAADLNTQVLYFFSFKN